MAKANKDFKSRDFSVRIVDKDNNTRNIIVSGKDYIEARQQALKEGTAISVKRKRQFFVGVKLTSSERYNFLIRLSTMVASNLGTGGSLELIAETFTGNIRAVSKALLKKLETTDSFGEAMEEVGPAAFPAGIVALVKAGELGGSTGEALKDAAEFERELNDIKKESSKGMGSAIFGFFFAGAFLIGSSFYMSPKVKDSPLFQDVEMDTQFVDLMANVLGWVMIFVMILFIMLVFLSTILKRILPDFSDKVILMIPFYRDLVLSKNSYATLYGLSMLVGSGVNVEDSLRITRDNAPKGALRNDLTGALNAILDGKLWPSKMSTLHETDRAALITSSDKEQVATTLNNLSFQYRKLYGERLKIIIPTMQLISALLLSVTGSIMFGQIIMPMLKLTQSLA